MSLTGVWVNKSRSILLLHEHEDGAVAGKFRSIVGRDPSVRILTGRTSPVENGKQMLGFAVQFQIQEPAQVTVTIRFALGPVGQRTKRQTKPSQPIGF